MGKAKWIRDNRYCLSLLILFGHVCMNLQHLPKDINWPCLTHLALFDPVWPRLTSLGLFDHFSIFISRYYKVLIRQGDSLPCSEIFSVIFHNEYCHNDQQSICLTMQELSPGKSFVGYLRPAHCDGRQPLIKDNI